MHRSRAELLVFSARAPSRSAQPDFSWMEQTVTVRVRYLSKVTKNFWPGVRGSRTLYRCTAVRNLTIKKKFDEMTIFQNWEFGAENWYKSTLLDYEKSTELRFFQFSIFRCDFRVFVFSIFPTKIW